MRNISSIRYNTPYEAVLIALVALWGLLYAVSPCNFDDFWFTPENWDGMGPWQKIAACFDLSFERCTHTDSGRFVNFTCAPFLAPPRWIFGIFMALCLWLTTRFMDWMAGCGYRSLRLWLILAAFVFILPWYDYMLSTIFALNYAVYVSPRTGWGVQLFGIIGSAALLPIFRFGFLKNRIVRFCVALTLAGAVLFNLTAALREQTELSREAREIVRIYTSGTDGVVFYDNIKPKLTPALY